MLYSADSTKNGRKEAFTLAGLFLKLAYNLRRHLWLAWPLARWLGLLIVACAVVGTIGAGFSLAPALLGLVVLVLYLGALGWASRRRYLWFESVLDPAEMFPRISDAPSMSVEELVPVRASGFFSVEGQERYFVDLEADIKMVACRERIVMGRAHPSRFLLLGRWPVEELGWWYIFVSPSAVEQVNLGRLHFGRSERPAIRVMHTLDGETQQTAYIASEDLTVLRRVWDNLLLDVSPEVYR
jgi:hypothetical protein